MDRWEEALDASQQVVDIQRTLMMENPVVFNSILACSLEDLSICLSAIGCQNEALNTSQEVVEIRQKLAMEHPAK